MNQGTPPYSIEILKDLSVSLASGIAHTTQDLNNAQTRLGALQSSKELLDDSLAILENSNSSELFLDAYETIIPSGSLLLPISDQLKDIAYDPTSSILCDQIKTTMQASVSAFAFAASKANIPEFDQLKQKLAAQSQPLETFEGTLRSRLEPYSPHLAKLLEGALTSYNDLVNPLRFSNTGNALRELIREFLAVVAPDDEIMKSSRFVPDKTSRTGVTRRHRLEYAVFGNLNKSKFPDGFVKQVDETASALLETINELSAYTHVNEKVLSRNHVDAILLFTDVMQHFLLLISAIETSRVLVEKDIATDIQSSLDSIFTCDFFDELDCLSSHTRPQGVTSVEIIEISFTETHIEFDGKGVVECDLQYGSDGDVSRGDGAEWVDSFSFSFSGKAFIEDITRVEIDRDSINIDTSAYDHSDGNDFENV